MADGRFLSRRIGESHQVASVSIGAALLFTWCIPHLDVEGRMTGDPALVKAKVIPLRRDLPELTVPDLLAELAHAGLVTWYSVKGRQYLAFPTFHEHQRGLRKDKEAPSRIPAPDAKGAELVPTTSVLVPSDAGLGRGKGREGKGEGEGEEKRSSVATLPARAEQEHQPTGNGGLPREAPNPFAVLFPLIREHLWRPDKQCPAEIAGKPWSEGQEGTVIRDLLKSYSLSDLEVVVMGLGNMLRGLAEAERPSWLDVGAKASLRAVFHTRSGVVQMVEHCRRAYWSVENKRPKKPPVSQPTRIGDALPGVLP